MELSPLGWTVIIFLVVVVISINLSLINMYRRKGSNNLERGFLKKVAGQLRNPWEEEDKSLAELSRRVAKLKSIEEREDPPGDEAVR